MRVFRELEDLSKYVGQFHSSLGCFADSGFLYALSYDDDQYYERALDIYDLISDGNLPIYANVISRMEFIDLVFRKQVTLGAIQLLDSLGPESFNTPLYRLLRNIRDQNTAVRNKSNQSFKIGEKHLKELRQRLNEYGDSKNWLDFCDEYVGSMLKNEWKILEEELGLRFLEIMEGQLGPLFNKPVSWSDMVDLMAEKGIRGPDAMIVNLFSKSKLPLLVTTDGDLEESLDGNPQGYQKAIFVL